MAPKKPTDKRQNRITDNTVVDLEAVRGSLEVPDPSPEWLDATAEDWRTFWADEELRSIVRTSHLPALVRLFDWRDQLRQARTQAETLRKAVGADHMVEGSTGQQRANPLYDQAEKAEARALQIEGRIGALEDRFGLTPGSMLKLGVDFQRKQNLEATNRRIEEALRGSSPSAPADDPRALPRDTAVDAS